MECLEFNYKLIISLLDIWLSVLGRPTMVSLSHQESPTQERGDEINPNYTSDLNKKILTFSKNVLGIQS